MKYVFCLALFMTLFTSGQAVAQSDREMEMFGGNAEEEKTPGHEIERGVVDEIAPDEKNREEAMFGNEWGETGVSSRHRDLLELDRLQIGGMLYMRYSATAYDRDDFDPVTSMPNLLDLYVDGRPNDRIRGFVKGRLKFDPVTTSRFPWITATKMAELKATAQTLAASGLLPPEAQAQMTMLTEAPPKTDTMLDQFWLKFDVGRQLFVTLGKQPVHWGTTRLWNPVDVVNSTRREPLTLFDERAGITALKLHMPIESLSWNLIALLLLEDADSFGDVGGALRLETVFSTMEMSLSGMVRSELQADGEEMVIPKIGLDLSAGIWELDVTAEAAVTLIESTRNVPLFELGNREAELQAAGGVSYSWKYSDEDFMVIGSEYFFNPEGVHDKEELQGEFSKLMAGEHSAYSPFYSGQHYGALFVALPSPGNWDYTSFTVSNIANFTDMTFAVRFDFSTTFLTYLSLQAYVMAYYGEKGGEFRFSLPENTLFPGAPEMPAQLFTTGINLRVDI
jgi:hypothetical protein